MCDNHRAKTQEWKDKMVIHQGYEVRIFYVCQEPEHGLKGSAVVALRYKGKSHPNQIRECQEGDLPAMVKAWEDLKNPPTNQGRPSRGHKKVSGW